MLKKISVSEVHQLCLAALQNQGASKEQSESVAKSLVVAELQGKPALGISHLFDYLNALREGRVDGRAEPCVTRTTPVLFRVDSCGGFPHTGVDRVFSEFLDAAQTQGIAALGLKNGYTCGELGYLPRRLAEHGLLGLAAANGGPAMLASSGSTTPVFCTNPMAFAVPSKQGPPLVIDQSSSSTAFVNLRRAAEQGDPIPEGWALDSNGQPTRSPSEALKGMLLAFGGERGANIALIVEVLAAGVTGANWSLDAPSFGSGDQCPAVGLLLLALNADLLLGDDFAARADRYFQTITTKHKTHLPGIHRGIEAEHRIKEGLEIPESLLQRMQKACL